MKKVAVLLVLGTSFVLSGFQFLQYLMDGSSPTTASPAYKGPIHFGGHVGMRGTTRAFSTASGMSNSSVASTTVSIGPIPVLSLGTAAQFNYPHYMTTDGTYFYVADEGNNEIREIQ